MEVKALVVLAVLIAQVCCDDLSGIHVVGNQFVNHANQTVTLLVREMYYNTYNNNTNTLLVY